VEIRLLGNVEIHGEAGVLRPRRSAERHGRRTTSAAGRHARRTQSDSDHTVGGPRQIWIASGIGIAPFLGWRLTAERVDQPDRIDLFHSTTTEADAAFLPDLGAATGRLPNLTLHPVFPRGPGRSPSTGSPPGGPLDADTHVFLRGPAALVDRLGHTAPARHTARLRPRRALRVPLAIPVSNALHSAWAHVRNLCWLAM
jgi:hypothetical protein